MYIASASHFLGIQGFKLLQRFGVFAALELLNSYEHRCLDSDFGSKKPSLSPRSQ
jgi:hypothetical protein